MGICGHRFLTNRRFFNGIVTYQKVFCMVTQLGSASNHGDDDGIVLSSTAIVATSISSEIPIYTVSHCSCGDHIRTNTFPPQE